MDPTRDFGEVARVIEIAFADELSPGSHVIMRDLHFMSAISPLLSLLGYILPSLRDYFSGYVWEHNGKVVANTTVSRADSRGTQWIISNVAVLPTYRRQGIAREMMEAAIEHVRARGGLRILLQVRTDNLGAKALYEQLGFHYLESVTELVSARVQLSYFPHSSDVVIREPVSNRWYEAYEVARAATPPALQQLRPLRPQNFRLRERSILERIQDTLFGAARERWWIEVGGWLAALLTIDRQSGQAQEQVEIMVHPQAIGLVESALVNHVTERLQGRRGVRVMVSAHLTDLRAHLREATFQEIRTLDQMVLEL